MNDLNARASAAKAIAGLVDQRGIRSMTLTLEFCDHVLTADADDKPQDKAEPKDKDEAEGEADGSGDSDEGEDGDSRM